MITFYLKSSDGCLCMCRMKSWDDVNHALLGLHWGMDEIGQTFEIITESEFNERRNSNPFTYMAMSLSPKETNRQSGYCIEYKPVW